MPLTRIEAAELVARLRKALAMATPGPWRIYHSGAPRTISADYGDINCIIAHTSAGKRAWAAAPHGEANAALIVATVNALPALLDLIEQHLEPDADAQPKGII